MYSWYNLLATIEQSTKYNYFCHTNDNEMEKYKIWLSMTSLILSNILTALYKTETHVRLFTYTQAGLRVIYVGTTDW